MVRGSGSYAFALALSCLFVAVMGAKHRMEEHEDKLKKASSIGLFMALVEPLDPVDVTFPLSSEHELQFLASREGLMHHVQQKSSDYDLNKDHHKIELREKTMRNADRTMELLLKAVKAGKTMQEARVGIALAQFQAMGEEERAAMEERAKKKFGQMPAGQREKMRQRMEETNHRERVELSGLATEAEQEAFVRARYKPSSRIPAELA